METRGPSISVFSDYLNLSFFLTKFRVYMNIQIELNTNFTNSNLTVVIGAPLGFAGNAFSINMKHNLTSPPLSLSFAFREDGEIRWRPQDATGKR